MIYYTTASVRPALARMKPCRISVAPMAQLAEGSALRRRRYEIRIPDWEG